MSQIIEAFEKHFRCVKVNMPKVVQNCTTSPRVHLYEFRQMKTSQFPPLGEQKVLSPGRTLQTNLFSLGLNRKLLGNIFAL